MEAANRYRIYVSGPHQSGSTASNVPTSEKRHGVTTVDNKVPNGRQVHHLDVETSSDDDAGSFCRDDSLRSGLMTAQDGRLLEEEEEEASNHGPNSSLRSSPLGVVLDRHHGRRDSPSHRSQDSGFSDSGESNCGQSLPPTINNAASSGPSSSVAQKRSDMNNAFRRKASRVFYASDDALVDDWGSRQQNLKQNSSTAVNSKPTRQNGIWTSPSASMPHSNGHASWQKYNTNDTTDATFNRYDLNRQDRHQFHHPVVRFGKTKSVPSLDDPDLLLTSPTSSSSNNGFSLSSVGDNIKRKLFGISSKSTHELSTIGSTSLSLCKSPVQKGILKKHQNKDGISSHQNRPVSFNVSPDKRTKPWSTASPQPSPITHQSYNCWSTAVLAKEVPTWGVVSGGKVDRKVKGSGPTSLSSGFSTWDSRQGIEVHPEFSAATLPRHRKKYPAPAAPVGEHPSLRKSGSSVRWWWTDLRKNGGETECSNVLQGKSLLSDKRMAPAINASRASSAIKTIQRRAHVISGEFVKLCQQLENHMFHRIPPISQDLVVSIEEFLDECQRLDTEPPHQGTLDTSPQSLKRSNTKTTRSPTPHQSYSLSSSPSFSSSSHSPTSSTSSLSSSPTNAGSCASLKRRLRSQENSVRRICAQLRKTSSSSPKVEDFRDIVQMVASLGHAFTRLVNIMLTGQIEVLLVSLEQACDGFDQKLPLYTSAPTPTPHTESLEPYELGATIALKSLIAVGLGGFGNGGVGGLSALVAAAGGIRILLSLCLLPSPPAPRALALRALAALCCVPQAIRQLDEAGGIEVLADILCEDETAPSKDDPEEDNFIISNGSQITCRPINNNSNHQSNTSSFDEEKLSRILGLNKSYEDLPGVKKLSGRKRRSDRVAQERTEAAGVLAQVTSPWIEENHRLGGLQEHLRRIVMALTELCKNGADEERFLLASASLANLSFLAPEAIEIMRDISAAHVLIKAARKHRIVVFAKDQIATVLANMAASPMCRETVASDEGLRVLHDFLMTSPTSNQRPAEVSACERVQQKSAIALSRLCSEASVAKKVVDMRVVERLVFLCRDDKERNQSDAVLIGCLAALRKIVAACGVDPLKRCNASDLVEPRLLDSFLLCSSQQESYV